MTATTLALPKVRVRAAVTRLWGVLCPFLRRAPGTTAFAVVLLGTTVALRGFVADQEALLRWASTNLDNLATRPVRSMVVSALFLPEMIWLPYAVAIAMIMVPFERRFGSLRTMSVFVSAHVLATLVTEGGVAAGIRLGVLPAGEAGQLDVGISYGLWACGGAALLLVPPRWRLAVGTGAAIGTAVPLILQHDMTTTGHALSFLIGLAWWPVLRRALASAASA